jgi:hypothetical protein
MREVPIRADTCQAWMETSNWAKRAAGNALCGHHLLQLDVTMKLLRFLTQVRSTAMTRILPLVEMEMHFEMHLLSRRISLARNNISLLIMQLSTTYGEVPWSWNMSAGV